MVRGMYPIIKLWYCKFLKKEGKPIMVQDMKTKKTKNTNKFHMRLYDKQGNPVDLRMEFANARGKAKASGASTILEIWK